MGLFDKLKGALKKTKDVLRTDVRDLFKAGVILDDEKLEEFHRGLITTDMGVVASGKIVDELRDKFGGRTVHPQDIWGVVKSNLKEILRGKGDCRWDVNDPLSPLNLPEQKPAVILVCGVNGVGKTTSIAKLASYLQKSGKSVVLAAGDTFRAAAVEQLTMWAGRLGCEIVRRNPEPTPQRSRTPVSIARRAGCRRRHHRHRWSTADPPESDAGTAEDSPCDRQRLPGAARKPARP
ncbi:MAG: zeta toxin family protein [Planctomycetaceae bacterium]